MYTTRSPGLKSGAVFDRCSQPLRVMLLGATAEAQTGTIAGTVWDGSGRGLSAVRLQVVGSQTLASGTDDRGRYVLRMCRQELTSFARPGLGSGGVAVRHCSIGDTRG